MTDKQIIIDGIDVSGCEWYSSTYFKPCDGCKSTPDCYYKNWQRKEQECERLKNERTIDLVKQLDQLKEQLEAYKMEAEEGKEINAELKVENEELKFQNKRLDEVATHWHKSIFKVERNERKLKQTLTEIKEIAEGCYDPMDKENDSLWTILQKISECEAEE